MASTPVKQVFTILGCGSSHGVPRADGDWGSCDPENPKNRRRRASLLIEQIASDGGKTTIVIDTGPDFREQMISAGVKNIDAVFYTHQHADHTHGVGDLRGFVMGTRNRINIYADAPTIEFLYQSFGYCLKSPPGSDYPPIITSNVIEDLDKPIMVTGDGGDIELHPLDLIHGPIHSLGFRIGNFAYCSDVNDFPDKTVDKLSGLETLIIDATLPKAHFSHFSLGQAVSWVEKLAPKKAYLTHMHTPMDYDDVMTQTDEHIEPAYDGLQISQET